MAPDDDTAASMLSLLYQLEGSYDKSEEVMRNALAVAPDNPGFLTNDAQILISLQRNDDALAQLDKALTLVPGDVATQKLRATTLQALGRHQDALVQLDALAGVAGKDAEILFMQGQSLQALNRKDDAAKAYEAAIALDPTGSSGIQAQAFLRNMTAAP